LKTISTGGLASNDYDALGSTSGGLYAVDTSGTLYSVNARTGAATAIGSTGLDLNQDTYAISSGLPILYFTNGSNAYELSTSTGAATFLGSYSAGDGFNAAAYVGGGVYAAAITGLSDMSSELYAVSVSNESVTEVGVVSPASGQIYGLAAALPEPSAWTMMIVGVGLLGASMRRQHAPPAALAPFGLIEVPERPDRATSATDRSGIPLSGRRAPCQFVAGVFGEAHVPGGGQG
jgi:hypothetical protein